MSVPVDAAAKHLFRHLHDARALRKNPLVRRFFEDAEARSAGPRDRAILERIHERVREGADRCRDADLRVGDDERALRRHTIVVEQCLGRRSIAEVARELGISFGYCYQERAEICRRVARCVGESGEPPAIEYLPQLDEFRALADRTLRTGFVDIVAAQRECHELVRAAPSGAAKVEALRVGGLVALQFGDVAAAASAHASAQSFYDSELAAQPAASQAIARASLEVLGSKLAYHRDDSPAAIHMLEFAVEELARVQTGAPAHVREFYAQTLYELGVTFANFGALERAHACVAEAESRLLSVRTASVRLRTRIRLLLWKLRSHLLTSSTSWFPSWQRAAGLTSAFEEAYAAGLVQESLLGVVALAEHHAASGNGTAAFCAAQTALALAKGQPNARLRAHTAIEVATVLLATDAWKFGVALLPDARTLDLCDPYHRELVTAFSGVQVAFRVQDYARAWARAGEQREPGQFTAITLSRQLVAAEAAFELGRKRDAYALLEAAIPAAEALGAASSVHSAYEIGAEITGDARLRRRARELARLLTA